MKKLLFVSAIILIIGAGYFYSSRNTGVVAFGDSLTYGTGSSAGGGFIKMLSDDLKVPITNLGVVGDTTADALKRVEEVTKLKPAVTIVLLGGNDYLQDVSETETLKNTEEIIKQIQKSGSKIILITLNSRHTALVSLLASKYGAILVPNILDGILGHTDMMSDIYHPNDKGYRLMNERIKPVLMTLGVQK